MPTSRINTAGVQYVRDHLAAIPRPDREVARAIRAWLLQHEVQLAPEQIDVVTLHIHEQGLETPVAMVVQRVSLTQAVLMNWQGESNNDIFGDLLHAPWAGTLPEGSLQIVETLPAPPLLHNGAWYRVFNGLFRRTEDGRLDHSTLLGLSAETLQSHIEAMDYHAQYKALLDGYWQDHLASHRLSCKLNFIAACNRQVAEGSLSDAARKLIWRACDLLPRGDRLRLSTLSIYGYAATDLLYINDAISDMTVLYVPGNSSPLLEFASETALKDWIGTQCKDPAKRQALKQHFRLADGPQGIDFSGLDTALKGLGAYPASHALPPEHGFFNDDGVWSPRDYVNYRPAKYNPKITGDIFQALAERQRQRSYDDADFIITSNSEVSKDKWRHYLNATLNLVAPLSFVVPGLAPLLAIGGIVQLGLGLDQVITGKHLQEQQEGVGNITWGLFNALPLLIHGASRSSALFEVKNDSFVAPTRVNDQIGYPLSPLMAPQLPDIDVAPYFHTHAPIAPLPDGDPAVAEAVIRVPQYDGGPDQLQTSIGGYNTRVVYDMAADVFIDEHDLNDLEPVGHVAQPNSRNLRPLDTPREVTDAMRTRSLRALGVDLPLPVHLPAMAEGSTPIPKQISCLWVGDRVINPSLIDNLASNAARLRDSEYGLQLFLSNASPAAYAENVRLLTERAPGLQVLPLEEQGFFRNFRQGPYHAQYQAALDGNGGVASNYASAADVLRYPMLHELGGLYMDVDDVLLPATEGESIDHVPLLAGADGLLLPPPMSNERLSMNCLYNTSLIGSHPGNPTLLAISEEMRTRYLAHPDFYEQRPTLRDDPPGFYRYAERLSQLTGPALLTAVIDQRLPALRTLRQVMNLYTLPRLNSWQFVDLQQYNALLRELLPLNRFARPGHFHAWARP
ncbi:dermonecrotic toxin domain-containing protein [Pseudomonas fluorescens]|uniref:dermonecrotic toxin domain-containing protein n=1 Tax=Pseudomonas fluorescens TaxID=294 RepID=UPI0020C4E2A0|nr:DUF6543 domain-containing protein [Pseudomonas fluorescens]UTL92766.1 mannosyltransferase [Pseudomonas fluorescens]